MKWVIQTSKNQRDRWLRVGGDFDSRYSQRWRAVAVNLSQENRQGHQSKSISVATRCGHTYLFGLIYSILCGERVLWTSYTIKIY